LTKPRIQDELAGTLQRLRTEAGLTQAEVANEAGVSTATVSRLERGKYVPSPEQAQALARAVGASALVRKRLISLAADLKERTAPRQVLLRGGATAQKRYGEIERAAGHVQSFSPVMVVGLLQTVEYARAVFAAVLPPEQVEPAVQARVERQQLLSGEGPALTQIITEGALMWHVGSPNLMAAQCTHIADLALVADRLRIGVIPSSVPADVFPMTGFDLYDERAVIVGTITGTAYITNSGDVSEYVRLFRRLVDLAVWGDEARVVLQRIADKYRALTG